MLFHKDLEPGLSHCFHIFLRVGLLSYRLYSVAYQSLLYDSHGPDEDLNIFKVPNIVNGS